MTAHNTGDRGATLDGVHGRIHAGQVFISCEFNTIIGSGELIYLISTGNHSAHVSFDIATNGELQIILLKQVTASATGSLMNNANANDFSTNNATTTNYSGTTLSDRGDEWEHIYVPGGQSKNSGGHIGNSRIEEFILMTNDYYAVSITNMGSTTIDIGYRISWYEPEV